MMTSPLNIGMRARAAVYNYFIRQYIMYGNPFSKKVKKARDAMKITHFNRGKTARAVKKHYNCKITLQ